ncbi:IQ-domain 11 [Forsythia ovata]|uniref:IQ-domain 11 n=1 Tax=Forsythia ovata TaxID=205694 RepID=A0ABD1TPF8_9LAMI
MAKKKSWFSVLKRFFEKKDKRKRWVFFRFVKRKQLVSGPRERTPEEAQEQSIHHDVNTTVAASEQANSITHHQEEIEKSSEFDLNASFSQLSHEDERGDQDLAATKIQAVFRGYLARKALRALKGVVKLQALIRGWGVRRQAINTLKCLQTIVNIQSEVCAKRCERVNGTLHFQEYKPQDLGEKDIKIDWNSQKRWDDSTLTREESKVQILSKKEAAVKRERIKEYYLHHRRSAESERDKISGRRRYWLEQWVDAQLAKRDDIGNLDTTFSANARNNRDELGSRLLKLRNMQKQYQSEVQDSTTPRKSFHHRKQRSVGENSDFPGSPAIPTYMAATESAKAKVRSMSSPRLRPINLDVCSEINSPYKHRLSPVSSINSELTSRSWVRNAVAPSDRSPQLKGVAGPVKSSRTIKELRLDFEGSLPNSDRRYTNR